MRISGTLTPKVQTVTVQPENVVYNAGDTFSLTGKNKWIKDDTDHSKEQRDTSITADDVVEAVDNDQSFVDLTTTKSPTAAATRPSPPSTRTAPCTPSPTASPPSPPRSAGSPAPPRSSSATR